MTIPVKYIYARLLELGFYYITYSEMLNQN